MADAWHLLIGTLKASSWLLMLECLFSARSNIASQLQTFEQRMSDIEEQLDTWEDLKTRPQGRDGKAQRVSPHLHPFSVHRRTAMGGERLPTTVLYDTINLQVR